MDLGRAARYGLIGAVGFVLISLGTGGLMGLAWADRVSGHEGRAMGVVAMVGIAGTALAVLYLFVVVGAFVDRELEARGLGGPDE